jgi:hypothetical protein
MTDAPFSGGAAVRGCGFDGLWTVRIPDVAGFLTAELQIWMKIMLYAQSGYAQHACCAHVLMYGLPCPVYFDPTSPVRPPSPRCPRSSL